ncbi:MAG: lytic transglycosylase domain-containing protein [Armatimonadota bacterium]
MLSRLPTIMQRISTIEARLGGLTAGTGTARPVEFATALNRAVAGQATGIRTDDGAGFDAIIEEAARVNDLSEDLIHAVVRAESGYDPRCRSSAGAMGLMQLMPGTARALGVTDPWDPAQNVHGGARYLRAQLERFGDRTLALAAYNAGPGAVRRYDGVPPYAETQAYVRRVERYLQERTAAR